MGLESNIRWEISFINCEILGTFFSLLILVLTCKTEITPDLKEFTFKDSV